MDIAIVRDIAKWTDGILKSVGLKPLPPAPAPSPPPPITGTSLTGALLSPTARNFVRCAGLSGTLAIFLGVYGAHSIKDTTPEELRRLFQMAQTYHLLHSVALLGLPLVSRPMVTGSLFIGGITLFCGPMYVHAIRSDPQFRRLTPYGGLLLLAGWISIFIL